MTKEIKAKFLEALRSGDYKQHTGQLRDWNSNKYCCLGIYCLVRGLQISDDGRQVVGNEEDKYPLLNYDPLNEELGQENVRQMYVLNDREKKSFAEIADWVEENIPAE